MDLKLTYWTLAFVNLVVIAACLLNGVRRIRRGDVRGHRRSMGTAAILVGLFLLSYLLKLALLGREDRAEWTSGDLLLLSVHELCVAVSFAAGVTAALHARRFREALGSGPLRAARGAAQPGRRAHRRAGRTAVVGGLLALVTALGVLVRMLERASG
ncbi:MAG: DUF420 domain-containing protein [Myxococcales bacterium]|nr:DUF420 domain-containing protein [Myxococcales bacterium]MDH5307740.1 DUF420 domain-containing protein [Myxococcales bacterium]MDH5566421.1 DUF420 domain-containing protein [Myxococcales bacterium]